MWFVTSAAICVGVVSGGLWLTWINYISKIAAQRD
ncbi:unnamed protein product, partial [marine sediment metagenome]